MDRSLSQKGFFKNSYVHYIHIVYNTYIQSFIFIQIFSKGRFPVLNTTQSSEFEVNFCEIETSE